MVNELLAPPLVAPPATNGESNEEELQVLLSAGDDGDFCNKQQNNPTREERLEKHRMQCQNLVMYLVANTCPPSLTKKETRNIKNQGKTHQWDSKSKTLSIASYTI